jgi:hypothetical protein
MIKGSAIVLTMIIGVFLSQNARANAMSFGYGNRESPAVNVYLSARYDHLLQTNPRFRRHRMWIECHTINWVPLHSDCIASFDQFEPVLPRYSQS